MARRSALAAPAIRQSAHGLQSCALIWPPPTWITAIQANSHAPWAAGRRHRLSVITALGALENQFGRRLLSITLQHQARLWIQMDCKDKTWSLSYETSQHCVEITPLLPTKTTEEWPMGIFL
jgi:hypothetical protein